MIFQTGFVGMILIVLILCGCLYNLFSLVCVVRFFSRKRDRGVSAHIPVSILKPLKGTDPQLRENLLSFCKQEYPEYEVLFGFTDLTDEAVPVAEETISAPGGQNARIVISGGRRGVNDKVSNLEGLVKAARYPLVAISDSDMRVGEGYLSHIVREYQEGANVGLVTSLYNIPRPASIGAALESLTIALDFIPSVLAARRLEGITFGLGASMLTSKEALFDIGGINAVADYLADDYQIGNRLWKKGYGIVLSDYVIEDVAGAMSVTDYLTHQLRWARTYRSCRPKGFLGYGIAHIFPFSIALFLLQGPVTVAAAMLAAVLAIRLGIAITAYKKIIKFRKWLPWLVLLPLKDILGFGIWLWSFLGQRVLWRGRYYRIVEGGKIERESP